MTTPHRFPEDATKQKIERIAARFGTWIVIAVLGIAFPLEAAGAEPDPSLRDVFAALERDHPVSEMGWHIHDPSRIVKIGGWQMVAVSGKENCCGYECGIETWFIAPGSEKWTPGQCLLTEKPDWIAEHVPNNDGAYWAPTFAGPRTLYYCVASMDDDADETCIGRMTASGSPPSMTWTDSGDPITCTFGLDELAKRPLSIDPALFDDKPGSQYLIYGGGYIYAAELDPATGGVVGGSWWEEGNPHYYHLASLPEPGSPGNPDGLAWVEAPYLHRQAPFYYLFVNWGACCRGLDSTYEIRVGRSTSPTGPFLDRDGVDMRDTGGTVVLDSAGDILGDSRYIGPGHSAIYEADGRLVLSFHYYDGENDGIPWIGQADLLFIAGWPVIDAGQELLMPPPRRVSVRVRP